MNLVMKNFFTRNWDLISKWFSGKKMDEERLVEEELLQPVGQDIPAEIIQIAEGAGMPDAISQPQQKLPGTLLIHCWIMGFKDGKNQQPQAKASIFSQLSQSLKSRMEPNIAGDLAKAKKEYELQEEEIKEADSMLRKIHGFVDDIISRRALNPEKFSSSHMIIYFVCAIILLLADIPLGLMVTEEVFKTNTGRENNNILILLEIHWQAILMTLGIVLSSIFFKIAYEELMLTPMDRVAGMIPKLIKLNKDLSDENYQLAIINMARIRTARFIVIILLLVAIFTILYQLGDIRYITEKNIDPNNNSNQMILSRKFFIALSLLFPCLSGICFAYSSHIFNMTRLYKYTQQQYVTWKEKVRVLKSRLFELAGRIEALTNMRKKYESKEYEMTYEKLFSDAYQHGYLRGLFSTHNEQDPYEQASRAFEKFITLKEFERLNPEMTRDN